jgi:Ca2+-binding RTX toxin-like protein
MPAPGFVGTWRSRRASLIVALGSAALLAVPAGAAARSASPARHAGTNAVAAAITSHVVIRAKSDPNGEQHKTRNTPVFSGISVSRPGTHGSASASASSSTTFSSSHGVSTVRSKGSLAAAAHCSEHTFCDGELETAVVFATGDASITVTVGATGTMPYLLTGTISANGHSVAPCAGVSVGLVGDSEVERHVVSGPIALDPGCTDSLVPRSITLLSHGILHSTGDVTFQITADTSFIDPGTLRTDRLSADWDLTLKLGPTCDLAVTDDPGYDPTVGATLTGTPNDEVICGGDGPDVLSGGGGTDKIYGGGGNDRISGRGTLSGDDGEDTLCGSSHADIIDGGGSADQIDGGPGPDTIDGGRGNDVIAGDLPTGGVDPDCLGMASGPAATDHIKGGPGNDTIYTMGGNDVVDGGSGDDLINGDTGRDHLKGGPGADKLRGAGNDDVLNGGSGRDVLNGGSGNDQIQAFDGARDSVLCGPGHGDSAELDSVDAASGCEATAVHR